MISNMTVIYLEHTGHVLAALARAVESGDLSAENAVGDELPLSAPRRSPSTVQHLTLRIPRDKVLAAKSVAFSETVLAAPQEHVVNGGSVARVPIGPPSIILALDRATIAFTLPAPVAADTKVLTVVAGLDPGNRERRVQAGVIAAGAALVSLNLTILPGAPAALIAPGLYGVCIALAGRPLHYVTFTVV